MKANRIKMDSFKRPKSYWYKRGFEEIGIDVAQTKREVKEIKENVRIIMFYVILVVLIPCLVDIIQRVLN